jgi:hypothetical protein
VVSIANGEREAGFVEVNVCDSGFRQRAEHADEELLFA